MKNFIQEGNTLSFLASVAVSSGQVVTLGNYGMHGIAATDVKAGEVGEASLTGVYAIPCAAGFTPDAFAPVYWNANEGEANEKGEDAVSRQIGYAIPFDATTIKAKETDNATVLRVRLTVPPVAES